ncbi:calcium/sodium antiporter [uncultured Faecalibaculum sp.]|uniref:calcium/sodium antiporter n=1 Tax=uncultured Faecalibaculum sp. TaxID=1729681 RepID=UPI00272C7866|nr:calcium/sodium antiporter [uncultured Faecalibaculum sp.]
MQYLLLLAGFVLLIKGADWFVDGAADAAARLRIPSVIVGLTIVSLGTSLPELSVSLTAALQGSNALALSKVIGSNLFNTLVVVGCSALIAPFAMSRETRYRDTTWNLGITLLLALLAVGHVISRADGCVLLAALVVYLVILVRSAMASRKAGAGDPAGSTPVWKILLLIAAGVICIALGGDLTVDAARAIALSWGWSEALVGLTIVSIGTSLPELVTSVVAAKKGESGLSIGNALGSNIMNIGFILGLSSAIHPVAVVPENMVDIVILSAVALLIVIMSWRSDRLTRRRGWLFIGLYACYFIYILLR